MTTVPATSAFLPLTDTSFDITSAEVSAARDLNWYARTRTASRCCAIRR